MVVLSVRLLRLTWLMSSPRLAARRCRAAEGWGVVVPMPTSLYSLMWPPDCLTKPYTIDRPRPVPSPSGLVVKKG